ncbi:hypothetical protein A3D78_07750 [Candidatus Gottesmanbacteria bacterium RIFCSPHIGHO2_02_FULL_39_14]|uniref:Prephenate dehydratase n=2 Tax=Candidatus Gottesmaniibacteriota TaxID=1752720 RepID=A0A1F6A2U1_9BACT|nr:MAG: hypothetical protein A3D78_07750 [Candidatus Gottesmanbacteria bacterium RIFCSPHIGHO2_02_FULL_39_14]OGG31055.1 MAG: hypothetical protein A3I51_04220 [Candidatus Gottesmanbacteria bacterium RIFCSPLOWO2_02_FULL_38_8]
MEKTILFLGNTGSNSHLAATSVKKNKDILLGKNTLEEIFDRIIGNNNYLGVIPIENSVSGSILESYDLIYEKKVYIAGELILKINHCLLSKDTASDSKLFKYCLSHSEAFKQCRKFMSQNPHLVSIITSDTASGAALLLNKDKDYCAIASKKTALIYGLKIIREHLEDNPANYSRFVIIKNQMNKIGDKVSLIFSLEHKPGSLVKVLIPYAERGLNLTKIESRPILGSPWQYIFYIDLEIKKQTDLKLVLHDMKKYCLFLKILGIYPKGKQIYA